MQAILFLKDALVVRGAQLEGKCVLMRACVSEKDTPFLKDALEVKRAPECKWVCCACG